MWISHIEIYSKQFRVGYRTSFPVIQLHKWLQLSNLAYAQERCAQVHARITLSCAHYFRLNSDFSLVTHLHLINLKTLVNQYNAYIWRENWWLDMDALALFHFSRVKEWHLSNNWRANTVHHYELLFLPQQLIFTCNTTHAFTFLYYYPETCKHCI